MRTPSKKSQKLNDYLLQNLDAKANAVAKLFKVSIASVYQRKAKLKSAASKVKQNKWARQNRPSTNVPNAIMSMAVYADDKVNSPSHYKVGGIETIDYIEAKNLGYNLGNVVKYVSRADYKGRLLEDLKKAEWYLKREIANMEKAK
jgi:hypothetical protein